MHKTRPWLHTIELLFLEEDPGGSSEDNSEEDDGKGDEGGNETNNENDPVELRKALRAERAERKRLEREKKQKEDADADQAEREKGEVAHLTKKLEDQKAINKRLGSMFFDRAINEAIEKEAKLLNFIDTDDAIRGVDRAGIDAEQDPDDPSVISIDAASIKRAVKSLADKKAHLIRTGTTDGGPTGSSFGRTKSKDNDKPSDEEAYLKKYANL